MSENTVERLRDDVEVARQIGDVVWVTTDDLAALLDVVDDVAHADINNAHLYCPFCGGDVRHPRDLGCDHREDCAYSAARRLCGMEGAE